jgi:hypothetical protein
MGCPAFFIRRRLRRAAKATPSITAMQMSETVTARQAEELRPGVLMRAQSLSVEIGNEK